MKQPNEMGFNNHDLRVVGFHVLIAGLQAALVALGAYHFGTAQPYVMLGIQVLSEALRRFVV